MINGLACEASDGEGVGVGDDVGAAALVKAFKTILYFPASGKVSASPVEGDRVALDVGDGESGGSGADFGEEEKRVTPLAFAFVRGAIGHDLSRVGSVGVEIEDLLAGKVGEEDGVEGVVVDVELVADVVLIGCPCKGDIV